jgi:uncharacterized protein
MKCVLFYGGPMAAGHNEKRSNDPPEELMQKLMAVYPEHRRRLDRWHANGRLLMVGTFADPLKDGSMGIFRSREDAEAFMEGDPFMLNGLIRSWRLMDWNEAFAD